MTLQDKSHEEGRLAFGVCGLGSGAQAGGLAPWARRRVLPPALLACLVCLLGRSAGGQLITNVIDAFNTNTYPNGSITNKWSNWFGGAFQSLSLDPTSDANSNPNSGSLKVVANFPVATDQFTVWNGYTGINPSLSGIQFTNFQCDVRFAAGSATNSSGNFGDLQFGMGTVSWGQDYWNSGVVIPASNTNWVHVSIPLNVNTDTNLAAIANVFVHIWGAGLVGPSTLWVDNIEFVGMATNSGTATINYTNTQQRIDGFGASSAWMSGSLANSDADLLFSTNTGAGLSLLRTRIAPDGTTWEGSIAQQAAARGARIWSTPWTPPANFKLTNSWIATNDPDGWNGGWFSNTVANCQGYANQLAGYVSWVQTNYGISLYGISIQNEPDANENYESCQWTSQDIHDFLPYLKAAMTASNVASTKILLPEDEGWRWNLATNAMNDPATSNQVDILADHNYGTSAAAVTQFGTPCPKTVWETEHYLGTDDSITNGLQLAQEIHSFMTVAQANAYHYWWLTGSGTGSIADDTANPAKRLFVMGNYSRFVRPNFYRVAVTNNATALVSAFKDPASSNFVIVAANPTANPVNQTFVLTNFPVLGPLRQWVTSGTESLGNHGGATPLTNGTFVALLPPMTVTTFVYQKPVTNPPTILQAPASQVSYPGGTVSFTVQASGGTIPLFYQWLFDGVPLAGATNATLYWSAIAATNAGNYSVVITNYAGSVTSSAASLGLNNLVWNPPGTISGPADIDTNGTPLYAYNNSGSSATVNGVTFAGVNSDTTWGAGVTLGPGWSATSTSAYAGGANPPWSKLPANYQTILQGGAWNNGGAATVTLCNLVVGQQYEVQVWVDDSRSGGTTNRTETLTDAYGNTVTLAYNSTYAAGGVGQFATGTFTATATNQSFTMNSAASTQLNALQVRDLTMAPSITRQPTNQIAYVNGTAAFAVTVNGSAPLNYQWFFNTNSLLVGATNANLALVSLAATNAGSYGVVITNYGGSITSATAMLTVQPSPHPVITSFWLSGANLVFSGTNGASPGTLFYTLASSNLARPLTAWMVIATNQFGPGGSFVYTNLWPMHGANWYFRLNVP